MTLDASLELRGLSITNPQAVLAGFGLLRLLAGHGQAQARLHWRRADHVAVLDGVDWDTLLATLALAVEGREHAAELHWADAIKKYCRDTYREHMQTCPPQQQEWLEAFWYERQEKGKTELAATKLDLTAGGLELLAAVRKLPPALRTGFAEKMDEALLGPWRNQDNIGSLGWDSGAVKAGATIAGGKKPENTAHATVSGALWLAFEALPLFPARWLAETGKDTEIHWALPHQPVGFPGLRHLLLAALSLPPAERAAQGWSHWSAVISRNGKIGYLQPAVERS